MNFLHVTFIAVGIAVTCMYARSYPLHASCHVTWHFDMSCDTVRYKLQQQFKAWAGSNGCSSGGQTCLYSLINDDGDVIKGTHESSTDHHIDVLSFNLTLSSIGHCEVQAFSTSSVWDSVLDNGYSYCNLKNIITGSGLDQLRGYQETTDDAKCTQHDTANCTVY